MRFRQTDLDLLQRCWPEAFPMIVAPTGERWFDGLAEEFRASALMFRPGLDRAIRKSVFPAARDSELRRRTWTDLAALAPQVGQLAVHVYRRDDTRGRWMIAVTPPGLPDRRPAFGYVEDARLPGDLRDLLRVGADFCGLSGWDADDGDGRRENLRLALWGYLPQFAPSWQTDDAVYACAEPARGMRVVVGTVGSGRTGPAVAPVTPSGLGASIPGLSYLVPADLVPPAPRRGPPPPRELVIRGGVVPL